MRSLYWCFVLATIVKVAGNVSWFIVFVMELVIQRHGRVLRAARFAQTGSGDTFRLEDNFPYIVNYTVSWYSDIRLTAQSPRVLLRLPRPALRVHGDCDSAATYVSSNHYNVKSDSSIMPCIPPELRPKSL